MKNTAPSSTGGVITYTKTGLIHTSGKSYSGRTLAAAVVPIAAKAI